MFLEPRRASALVHHQVSRALQLVLQRVHCHVWVVRQLRSYQQGAATGESTGPGLACPHLHYHPLGLELRLLCRSGALVVRGHQPSLSQPAETRNTAQKAANQAAPGHHGSRASERDNYEVVQA